MAKQHQEEVPIERVIYDREDLESKARPKIRELATETWGMDSHESKNYKIGELVEWILEQQEEHMARGTGRGRAGRKTDDKPAGRRSSRRSEKAEEEETKTVTRRRGRRKAEPEEEEEEEETPRARANSRRRRAAATEEEKPRRRGRRRAAEEEETTEETPEETPAEAKPRRRGRRKAAADEDTAEAAPVNEEKIDALGKTVDENQEVLAKSIGELEETLKSMSVSLFVLQGLVGDLYVDTFQDDEDLDERIEELEESFSGNEEE
jgi:hypothetical protein